MIDCLFQFCPVVISIMNPTTLLCNKITHRLDRAFRPLKDSDKSIATTQLQTEIHIPHSILNDLEYIEYELYPLKNKVYVKEPTPLEKELKHVELLTLKHVQDHGPQDKKPSGLGLSEGHHKQIPHDSTYLLPYQTAAVPSTGPSKHYHLAR